MDSKIFSQKLSTVPENIREYFGSEGVVNVVGKINESLGIPEEDMKQQRIIPRLLFRLEVKDIEPQKFTGELAAELNLEKNKALSLSHEILRLILLPIKEDLRKYGVDINLLEKFEAAPVKFIEKPSPAPAPLKDEDIEEAVQKSVIVTEADSGSVVDLKAAAAVKEEKKEEGPVILHTEEAQVKPLSGERTSGMGGLFGFFKKKPEASPEIKQVAAKVQFSFKPLEADKAKEPQTAKTAEPKIKVIHYSEFSPAGKNVFGGEAGLEKIKEAQKQAAASGQAPAPSAPVSQAQKEIKKIEFEPKIITPKSPSPPKPDAPPAPLPKAQKPAEPRSFSRDDFSGVKISPEPAMKQEKEIKEIKLEPKIIDFSSPPKPKPVETAPAPSSPPPPAPKPEYEVKLADVPVGEDIIDLRNIERAKNGNNGEVNLK